MCVHVPAVMLVPPIPCTRMQPYLAFKKQQTEWRAAHGVEVTGQSYHTCSPTVGYHTRS